MVVWYSPSRILMIFKTNNHFLPVKKYFVIKEIVKIVLSKFSLKSPNVYTFGKLFRFFKIKISSTFQEMISYLIWTLVNKISVPGSFDVLKTY